MYVNVSLSDTSRSKNEAPKMSESALESWQHAGADAAHAQAERGHLRCVGGHVPDRIRLWKSGNI